jgi:N-methylhydantoinase A
VRAAEAVIDAANASMRRALGVMTMQRGRDPRSTPLVAFGGGGGLAAAELARGLGMPAALIPASPGVLSAHGMTRAERSVDRSASVLRPLKSVTREARSAIIEDLKRQARTTLSEGEALAQEPRYEASLSVRYRGQSYELSIPDGEDPEAEFHRAHRARFGWTLEDLEVQLVHVRLRATEVLPPGGSDASGGATGPAPAPLGQRSVVFSGERLTVPVHQRDRLSEGARIPGPAIIEEYSGTTVLPPGSEARVVGGLGLLIQDSTS